MKNIKKVKVTLGKDKGFEAEDIPPQSLMLLLVFFLLLIIIEVLIVNNRKINFSN
jgi:hypothetical protein